MADWQCTTHDAPLGLAIQARAFSKIVKKSGKHHPPWMTITSDCFRCLQQMLDLGQIRVGVTVVNERIQKLRRFPNRLRSLLQAEVLPLLGENKIHCLPFVIEPVELCDSRGSRRVINAEFFLRLAFLVSTF